MNGIFLERDTLLGTQGPLVPYYWLVRTVDPEHYSAVRPFLIAFDVARQENRRLAKDASLTEYVDQELSEYDRLNRSINDVGSIEGRTEILLRRFAEYVETGAVRIGRFSMMDS